MTCIKYRLMHIQHEFIELEESLFNNKIVGKFLRVMLRRPRWKGLMSTPEALAGTQTYTSDELYAYFRSFEEKVKQSGKLEPKARAIAFPA